MDFGLSSLGFVALSPADCFFLLAVLPKKGVSSSRQQEPWMLESAKRCVATFRLASPFLQVFLVYFEDLDSKIAVITEGELVVEVISVVVDMTFVS